MLAIAANRYGTDRLATSSAWYETHREYVERREENTQETADPISLRQTEMVSGILCHRLDVKLFRLIVIFDF